MKINTISLDQFVSKRAIMKLDFIKMDIEGAEIEALEGMRRVCKNLKPALAIACYHLREGVETHYALVPALRKAGYSTDVGYSRHLTLYAEKKN